MKGFIRTRKGPNGKSRYQAIIKINGKQKSLGISKLRKNAEARLKKAEAELDAGTFGKQRDMTFAEFSETWLAAVKLDVKPSAYTDYETQIRVHLLPHFGQVFLANITPADVQTYRSKKSKQLKKNGEPLSPRTVNKTLMVLGAIFRWAVENGYLQESPSRFVKKVKEAHQEMDYLNPEEVRRFLDAASPEFYPLAATAAFTGMRQGELLGLKWGDVELDRRRLYARRSYHPQHGFSSTKTAKGERAIDLTPDLVNILTVHKANSGGRPEDLLFANRDGGPITPSNMVRDQFRPALERAKVRRIRFHDLRHSYASLMISMGCNLKYLQNQLGHSSLTTTLDTYSHLIPDMAENGIGEQFDLLIYPDREGAPQKGLRAL